MEAVQLGQPVCCIWIGQQKVYGEWRWIQSGWRRKQPLFHAPESGKYDWNLWTETRICGLDDRKTYNSGWPRIKRQFLSAIFQQGFALQWFQSNGFCWYEQDECKGVHRKCGYLFWYSDVLALFDTDRRWRILCFHETILVRPIYRYYIDWWF